jgi:hypothetical protein
VFSGVISWPALHLLPVRHLCPFGIGIHSGLLVSTLALRKRTFQMIVPPYGVIDNEPIPVSALLGLGYSRTVGGMIHRSSLPD